MNASTSETARQSGRTTLPTAKDKRLFTPGPLTTSLSVKQAMLHDASSWHFEFNELVAGVRERLLRLAGVSREHGWDTVQMQGSGTFGVEAVFQTCVPPDGKVAVFTNGAYGDRMIQMLRHARMAHAVLRAPEDQPVDPSALEALLTTDKVVTHVGVVHCETTTGILNPIEAIGRVCQKHGTRSGVATFPIQPCAPRVMYRALEKGLNFKVTMGNVLTFTPPLTITREKMDRALGIIEQCVVEVSR